MLLKIRVKLLFCCIIAFFATTVSFGQKINNKKNAEEAKILAVQNALDFITNNNDDGISEDNIELIFNTLSDYSENPININNSDLNDLKNELGATQLLSNAQIMSIITHREVNGKFMTKYELQTVRGWDANLINRMLPFLNIVENINKTTITLKEAFANGKQTITFRTETQLETETGYTDFFLTDINGNDSLANEYGKAENKRYLGSRTKLFARYNFAYGNKISFGFTGEKDTGEELFKGSQKPIFNIKALGADTNNFNTGFDYLSAHLYLGEVGKIGNTGINIKNIALGDYNAAFGQGLTFFSGFGPFKSPATPIEISARTRGIVKYAGSGDIFMRGAATTLEFKKIELAVFYSYRNLDARLRSIADTLNPDEQFNATLQSTTFHNTAATLAQKSNLNEQIIGGHASYSFKKLTLGATVAKTKYGFALAPTSNLDRPSNFYRQFRFNGSDNLLNMGVDYTYLYRNITFFGEISRSSQEADSVPVGYSMIHGLMASLSQNLSFSLAYRDLGVKYQNIGLKSQVLTAAGSDFMSNEKSFYMGMSASLSSKLTLNSYIENAVFPYGQSSSRIFSVSRTEFANQLTYSVRRKWEIYARYRNRVFEEIVSGIRTPRRYNQFRINAKFSPGNGFSFASRVEFISNILPGSYDKVGYVMYQDVTWKNSNWRSHFRGISVYYALFGGSGEPTYTYERGVAFGLTRSAFGSGSRIIIKADFQLIRNMKLNLLFSEWYKTGVDNFRGANTSDTAINFIEGPTQRRIDAQLIYKF